MGVVLVFTAALSAAMGQLAPARFAARPGWHVGANRAHPCEVANTSRCITVASWAATTRWRDCGWCLPHRTVAALAPDGIAMQLALTREPRLSWERTFRLPLHIRRKDVVAPFEGLPTRIGVAQRIGRVHRVTAYFFVFFGRPHPTARQLARANAELATARLP